MQSSQNPGKPLVAVNEQMLELLWKRYKEIRDSQNHSENQEQPEDSHYPISETYYKATSIKAECF